MNSAVRIFLGAMVVGGVIGLGHGVVRDEPVKDTLVGATAPLWAPVMVAGIPIRAAYLSCRYLNPAKPKQE